MRHRRRTRHRPNYLLRLGVLAFVFVAYSGSHGSVEPAVPDVAIWSPAHEEPTAKPTREPTARPVKPRVESPDEPIDCADQEDPDLCVELGNEYQP